AAPRDANPTPGSLASWLQSPIFADGSRLRLEFVKMFVLSSWWIGAAAGAVLLWQRGNRRGDVVSGAVAGAGAGFAGAATLACLLDVADSLPRAVLRALSAFLRSPDGGAAWFWTAVWLLVAVACWGLIGGVVSFTVRWAGRAGGQFLAAAAAPMVWLFQICGLKGLAALFD